LKKGKNILVITYWSIDNALIHTYTLPYLRQIKSCLAKDAKIYVLTLSPPGIFKTENNQAFKQSLLKENIHIINFTYYPFGLRMVLNFAFMIPYLAMFTLIKNIRGLHAWCTPGGAIAWPISILTGKPLVLDSFEPHAESMLEAGTWRKYSINYRLLFLLEKLQLKRAKEVICAAEGMIEHSKKVYRISKKRYFVKPAGVDLELFDPKKYPKQMPGLYLKKNVCVYAGKFGGIYLSKEIFDFFKVAYNYWNTDFTVLLLSYHSKQEILNFCKTSDLPEKCVQLLQTQHLDVAAYLSLANFAITPVKPLPSKLFCSPIKDGEYWAMGLPVIITKNISIDSKIIQDNQIGYVLKDYSETEYLNAIQMIEKIIASKNTAEKIRSVAKIHRSFENAHNIYQTIYAINGVYSNEIK